MDIGNNRLQILYLRQYGHIRGSAVAPALFHDTAAAEIKAVGAVAHPGQLPGIVAHRVLPGHEAVADDGDRQMIPLRFVLRSPDGQIAPPAFKCGFCKRLLSLSFFHTRKQCHRKTPSIEIILCPQCHDQRADTHHSKAQCRLSSQPFLQEDS